MCKSLGVEGFDDHNLLSDSSESVRVQRTEEGALSQQCDTI